MNNLLIASKSASNFRSIIESANLPELNIVEAPAADVNIVLGEPALIKELLPGLPALRWVQSTWAGIEPLLDASLKRDYVLTNARGVFGGLITEFVFGYLLLHERKILQRLDAQKMARWDNSLTGTLRGKTIGLMGVGSIGAHLARIAKSFGMQVHGYTYSSETCQDVNRYYHTTDILTFAEGVDVLVNTLPGTTNTQKIINTELLAALRNQAILINVGRGSAVEEFPLIKALESGKLSMAVLDVFEQEPLPVQHPFWTTKNLFITSHTAAPSFPEDIARVFIENYRLFYNNQSLKYQVNFERGY